MLKSLISQNIGFRDENGRCALVYALCSGNLQISQMLENESDLEDFFGISPKENLRMAFECAIVQGRANDLVGVWQYMKGIDGCNGNEE